MGEGDKMGGGRERVSLQQALFYLSSFYQACLQHLTLRSVWSKEFVSWPVGTHFSKACTSLNVHSVLVDHS